MSIIPFEPKPPSTPDPAQKPERDQPSKMKKLAEHALTGLVVTLIAVNIWWFVLRGEPTHPLAEQPAPAFSLVTLQTTAKNKTGPKLSLSDLRGKVVLLDFWATWCEPCKKQMPILETIHKDLPSDEFALVSVNMDRMGWSQRLQKVSSFVRARNYTFPVVFDDGSVSQNYQVSRIPTLILIDREGNIAQVHTGVASEKTLRAHIDKLRQGEPDA